MFTYESFRSIVKELDAVPIDAYNAPCVVNTDDIIVYDIENLDKVNELIYNSDKIALNYLVGRGVCNYVKKGTKGIYVRYLRDDYVVVKVEGELRPAIIPRSHISKHKCKVSEISRP